MDLIAQNFDGNYSNSQKPSSSYIGSHFSSVHRLVNVLHNALVTEVRNSTSGVSLEIICEI